jgi:basic membrane lipoprotein Med (substrate-binding protein (PBP1-ABC) superfamily)
MIAIKENAHKYEAEIKLCFNLLQDFLKDSFNDTDKERQLKEDIIKIDYVLKNGVEEEIVNCNRKITAEYSHVLTTPTYGFTLISLQKFQQYTYSEKCVILRNMGLSLLDLLFKEKGVKFTEDLSKNGVEYLIDKLKELMNKR